MTTVSVVIPTFDRRVFLLEALQSVFAQSLSPLEIIVVDDGSTDGTDTLDEELPPGRVRWIHQENRGPAAARNAGIADATGDVVAFLDSDDLWVPRKLELQVAHFDLDPGTGIVFGKQRYVHQRERGTYESGQVHGGFIPSSTAVRRALFDQVGLFDEKLRGPDFMDWMSRARSQGVKATMIDEVLMLRRIHGSNLVQEEPAGTIYLDALHAHLRRRRAASGS